ncbi:mitochondrial carrier domain-containing protein [Chytridium lagenaria]|nr:mitochondrial carrier domain-containing protein [Chytridium lagenaria]
MLPLLICNSIVGAVLFNAYSLSMHLLTTEVPTHDDEYEVKHHPFTSGAIAGAFQSLLATPIDNITRRVDPAQVAARRGEAMPKEGGRWAKMKFMYHGLPYNLVKDSMGFSLFFGLFETTRTMGKRFVIDLHDTYFWPRRYFYPPEYGLDPVTGDPKSRPTLSVTLGTVAAVIGAGSLAGAGYQVVAYPFDRLPKVRPKADEMEVKVDWGKAWKLVKRKGVAPFYRGIGTQLVRVAPPSAVGLLIFELANSQLWDEDD